MKRSHCGRRLGVRAAPDGGNWATDSWVPKSAGTGPRRRAALPRPRQRAGAQVSRTGRCRAHRSLGGAAAAGRGGLLSGPAGRGNRRVHGKRYGTRRDGQHKSEVSRRLSERLRALLTRRERQVWPQRQRGSLVNDGPAPQMQAAQPVGLALAAPLARASPQLGAAASTVALAAAGAAVSFAVAPAKATSCDAWTAPTWADKPDKAGGVRRLLSLRRELTSLALSGTRTADVHRGGEDRPVRLHASQHYLDGLALVRLPAAARVCRLFADLLRRPCVSASSAP